MRKFVLFIIILLILGGAYYFYASYNKQAVAPSLDNEQMTSQQKEIDKQKQAEADKKSEGVEVKVNTGAGTSDQNSQATFSGGEEGQATAPDILVVQVNYDGSKFEPASTDIKLGDIVIFKNNSSGQMWPASAPHPTHTDYPEFDAKAAISAGSKWQFKFEKAGIWRYHDHLNPTAYGSINVSAK